MRSLFIVVTSLFLGGCGFEVVRPTVDDLPGICGSGAVAERPIPPVGYKNDLPDPHIEKFYWVWLGLQDMDGLWCVQKGKAKTQGRVYTNNSTYPPTVSGITGRDFPMFTVWYRTGSGELLMRYMRNAFRHTWYVEGPNPWKENLYWMEIQ